MTKEQDAPTKEEIEEFVFSLFDGEFSVRGETESCLVTLKTPCKDFFYSDVDGVCMCIGRPIEERFGLQQFNFANALPFHAYGEKNRLGKSKDAFYDKYPLKTEIGTKKHTLKRFAEMVYDLVRIKHGLEIS